MTQREERGTDGKNRSGDSIVGFMCMQMKFHLNCNKKWYRGYIYTKLKSHANLMPYSYIEMSSFPAPPCPSVPPFSLSLSPSLISISLLRNPQVSSFAAHCRQPLFFFQVLEAMLALTLPTHKIAGEGEDGSVDGDPCEEDAQVEAQPGMQVEQDLMLGFDDCERRG